MNNGIIPVVFLDAIDFSGNNFPDFEGIKSLPLEQIVLVVDDSHSIGLVGPDGSGVYQILSKLNARELVVCCSLGKALGIQAGAIFCDQQRYELLTSTAFYAGASPAAPAYLATLLQGWDLVQQSRRGLIKKSSLFSAGIKNFREIRGIHEYPAFSYADPMLSSFFIAKQDNSHGLCLPQ